VVEALNWGTEIQKTKLLWQKNFDCCYNTFSRVFSLWWMANYAGCAVKWFKWNH